MKQPEVPTQAQEGSTDGLLADFTKPPELGEAPVRQAHHAKRGQSPEDH